MNGLIQKRTFRIPLCLLLIFTVGSCSIATKLPQSKFGKIDENESKHYYITLKDGTKYYARRIAVSDSTLTVFESGRSKLKEYADIAEEALPYNIVLGDIESVKERRYLLFLTGLVCVVVLVLVGGVIFSATWNLELGGT